MTQTANYQDKVAGFTHIWFGIGQVLVERNIFLAVLDFSNGQLRSIIITLISIGKQQLDSKDVARGDGTRL